MTGRRGRRPSKAQGAAERELEGAGPSAPSFLSGLPAQADPPSTTHLSVVDAAGNAVAVTGTINTPFGSGITVAGTGIVLNNEMDDFSVAPDTPNAYGLVDTRGANAVAAGKRPLSSMSPTIVSKDGELFLVGCHIAPYTHGNQMNHAPDRERKLLLKKREIEKLGGKVIGKGLTLVPLRAYLRRGRVKLEVGLGRGKRAHDKRETIKRRQAWARNRPRALPETRHRVRLPMTSCPCLSAPMRRISIRTDE